MTWLTDLLTTADALFPRHPGEACCLCMGEHDGARELRLVIPLRAGALHYALNDADLQTPGAAVAQAAFDLLAVGKAPWAGQVGG